MTHVISPNGWAVYHVNKVDPSQKTGWRILRLSPTVDLPPARLADIGGQCVEGEVGVTELLLGWAGGDVPQPPWFELVLGWKRYWVKLTPSYSASAPLSAPAHRLYILCENRRCDLLPLFALANPLRHPQYAAAVVRAQVDVEAEDRWIPLCDVVDCSKTLINMSSYAQTVGKGALDLLSDPEKVRTTFRLAYDRSKDARRIGYKLGIWTLDPDAMPKNVFEKGQFTVLATAAIAYLYPLMPPNLERYLRLQPIATVNNA
ncbi:MAG: hypothetical protein ACO2PN_09940 [Pyrobaculum sp.]|jgi:hypothetical protein